MLYYIWCLMSMYCAAVAESSPLLRGGIWGDGMSKHSTDGITDILNMHQVMMMRDRENLCAQVWNCIMYYIGFTGRGE